MMNGRTKELMNEWMNKRINDWPLTDRAVVSSLWLNTATLRALKYHLKYRIFYSLSRPQYDAFCESIRKQLVSAARNCTAKISCFGLWYSFNNTKFLGGWGVENRLTIANKRPTSQWIPKPVLESWDVGHQGQSIKISGKAFFRS